MKYIKIFETFGDYYSEISSDDYAHPKGNIDAMSENEFLKIKNKIESKGWETYNFKDTMLKYTENFENVCEITFIQEDVEFYNQLVITKMSDEFYYILLMTPRAHDDIKFKYYQADQLEGLEKFIDEVL